MNIVTAKPPAAARPAESVMVTDGAIIRERYSEYLGDESKLRADGALSIAFPRTTEELSALVAEHARAAMPIRVSGGRTGITGASVAEPGDAIISLDKLKAIGPVERVDGRALISVGAGVTLSELNARLSDSGTNLYFPVDATETSAALGGMAATNASGARSYHYDAMRRWVRAATIVLADGSVLELERGRETIDGGILVLDRAGVRGELRLPKIPKPPTKNTLGYSFDDGADALDVFVGSEGTLGIFAGLTLELAPVPPHRLFMLQLFTDDEKALDFVVALRSAALDVLAIEFFDSNSLELARTSPAVKDGGPAQLVQPGTSAAVYIEIVLGEPDDMETAFTVLEGLLAPLGASLEHSFAGTEERQLRELKAFRHAVPERINSIIAARRAAIPAIHKIATDMAVPDGSLHAIYRFYRSELDAAGLEYAVFGHAGNNHFHVNILPRDEVQLAAAKAAYEGFAREVVRLGGAVAAEHGIGKLKKGFLKLQYGDELLESMSRVKDFFDPQHLLNRNVLLNDKDRQ